MKGSPERNEMRATAGTTFAVALLKAAAACSDSGDLLDADTLSVGPSPGADFASVQAAVGSAKAGATIEVEAGTYVEDVLIVQSVTLLGAGGASILELQAGTDPVIETGGANGVRIEGFTVRGPADGIQVRDSRTTATRASTCARARRT
jgi:pectin methylesterase-like acyl-CoA thioesterase